MSNNNTLSYLRSPVTWLSIVVLVAAAGAFYWQDSREKMRERMERERVAAEQAEMARVKEAEDRREKERTRLVEEIRAQKEAEENQRQQANAIRQAEVRDKQFVSDDRYVTPQQAAMQNYQMQVDQRARDYDERRQRYQDANDLYKARQEVERQKRYVQQREYEEQSAIAQRDAKARYSR